MLRPPWWPALALAAALVALVALAAVPCGAVQITTSIDLNYSYEQARVGPDVDASTTYNQKYEVRYETSLSSSFDFSGAVRLELDDSWHTDAASTSKVAPTLEMEVKGAQAGFKTSYAGVISTTELFEENAESTIHSSSLDAELMLTPQALPEARIKVQRRRDYEEQTQDRTSRAVELQVRDDLYGLRLEFNFKREQAEVVLPVVGGSEKTDWTGKATYKEVLYGETEFELSYEIKEAYSEDTRQGVFIGETEEYTQDLKTRLKKPIELSPRLKLNLAWEYQYTQDLLQLSTDYEIANKYLVDLRYDLMRWAKIAGELKRETHLTVNPRGHESEGDINDSARISADLDPMPWLRVTGKAEFRRGQDLAAGSGHSIDVTTEEKYEGVLKNKFGDFWDLTLNGSGRMERTDGWLTSREGKFKSDLRLKLYDLSVQPSYEATRETTWDPRVEDPADRKQMREMKIRFEYRRQFVDLLQATFSHEYGVKTEDVLDSVLDFERTVTLNEGTRLTILLAEIVRDLRIEGELDRKGSDTRDDTDPMLVDVAYSLKLDYKLADLSLSASFKYNDKGDTFDDLSFNTKLGWKGERLDVSGEYQYDKIFADAIEEKRKLNLKLNYKF